MAGQYQEMLTGLLNELNGCFASYPDFFVKEEGKINFKEFTPIVKGLKGMGNK